jgi:hypothetical protein
VLEPMRKNLPHVPKKGGQSLKKEVAVVKKEVAVVQKRGPVPRSASDRWSPAGHSPQSDRRRATPSFAFILFIFYFYFLEV